MNLSTTMYASDIAIVQPEGRLDLLSAAAFKQSLISIIQEGHHHVVVDMDKVEFIDSSGLGALIGGLKAARLAGGDLRIAHVPNQARTVLELTTLNRVLPPFDTVDSALDTYRDVK